MRRISVLSITIAFVSLFAFACTTTHAVRTVGKGNIGVEGSFGGPMLTNLGAPIPAPNLFVGGRYGVRDDMDVSVAYNVTAPITPGIPLNLILADHFVPIQPGVGSQADSPEKGWSLATGASAHLLTDFETGFIAVPVFDVATGYRHGWFNPYVGVSLGLHFFRPFGDVHVPQLSPFVGADFILNRCNSISIRVTFFDVTYNYYGSQVQWVYLRNDPDGKKQYAPVGISLGFAWDYIRRPSGAGQGGAR